MDSSCLHPPLTPGGATCVQGTFAWLCHRFFQMVIVGQRKEKVSPERDCGSSCISQCFGLSRGHFLDPSSPSSYTCSMYPQPALCWFVLVWRGITRPSSIPPGFCTCLLCLGYSYRNCMYTVILGRKSPNRHPAESVAFWISFSLSLPWRSKPLFLRGPVSIIPATY